MTEEVISNEEERKFWGIHEFRETQDTLGCGQCGWGFHDPIHKS